MRKTFGKHKQFSIYFFAFLLVAVVFLALGLGTLGSFRSVGKDYELKVKQSGDDITPSVEFSLTRTGEYSSLRLHDVYVYTTAIYADEDKPAELAISRSSSSGDEKTYLGEQKGTIQNLVPEEGKESGLFRWVTPFTFPDDSWTTSTYWSYVRLTATTCNVRIAEVVFVGEKFNGDEGTGEYVVIPATILKATNTLEENDEQAKANARVLVDDQKLPPTAQSSYANFMPEEVPLLLTLNEMRVGRTYTTNSSGVVLNVYNGDTVYGTLGIDLLAFGTKIFGFNSFGLRFFPMLASFGVLVLGYFLTKRLTKSDLAGLVFAVLYFLCNLSFSLGHLGTPLMIGVFFLLAALDGCHRFYANGMKKANFLSVVPLLIAGLCGAAAICVNGAFVIPVAGVAALYVLGMLRQQKARRYYLDDAIAQAEAEESAVPANAPVTAPVEESGTEEVETGREKVVRVVNEYRFKNIVAGIVFPIALIFGTILLSLLCMIPTYFTFVKLYDNPASPSMNILSLSWHAFAGGFTGAGTHSAWQFFYTLFTGMGTRYAVTGAVVNVIGALIGLFGFGYAVYRLVRIFMGERDKEARSELRRILVPLVALVVTLIVSTFAKGALAFMLLADVFAYILATQAFTALISREGKAGKIAKIVSIVAVCLLAVWFALCFAFTFSVPLSSGLMGKLF